MDLTPPTPDSPNTWELLPHNFYSPMKYSGNLSLTGYKTKPGVMLHSFVCFIHLLFTAAPEFVHKTDVLMLPKKQDQRGHSQPPLSRLWRMTMFCTSVLPRDPYDTQFKILKKKKKKSTSYFKTKFVISNAYLGLFYLLDKCFWYG